MSDGHCDVDFGDASDDCDQCEFFVDFAPRRSRRDRPCMECGEMIRRGDTYYAAAYKFEGKFGYEHRCAHCHEAAEEFNYHIFGGSMWGDHFAGEWENGARIQSCLMRMSTVESKQHMLRRWTEWREWQDAREVKYRARLREIKRERADELRWQDDGGSGGDQ